VVETVEAVTDQHPMHRGGRHVQDPSDPTGTERSTTSQRDDPALLGELGLVG
jgi:hypothetical protein